MTVCTIGVLSDTHIPRRLKRLPEAVLDALAGVELVLHAGDVDDPAALEPLEAIAPVHAVRGNIHFHEFSDGGASLPAVVELQQAGYCLVLTHGYQPDLRAYWLRAQSLFNQLRGVKNDGRFNRSAARRLAQRYPEADIIIFGHSHQVYVEQVEHALLVNPGAVCPTPGEQPTVARLRLGKGQPHVEIVPLLTGAHSRLY